MDGFIIINKPKGITSHDVVQRTRQIAKMRRVGHSGTLDPLATGVLLILIGQATRLNQYIGNLAKEYEVVAKLGVKSETYDSESEPIPVSNKKPSRAEIEKYLSEFTGNISQTPPSFSAIKIRGRKAYDLARAGKMVKLKPRPVTIHDIRLVEYNYLSIPHSVGKMWRWNLYPIPYPRPWKETIYRSSHDVSCPNSHWPLQFKEGG